MKNKVLASLDWLSDEFETSKFPEPECIIQGKEKGILESGITYICALVHKDWHDQLTLRVLSPYTWTGDVEGQTKTLYGWTDGINIYDHKERNIHDDDEVVVAWLRKT